MRIYPAVHYTMGGLWVDYNLMSNVPGLFVLGEANFSDHGANRLGASALMQGLADGYFVLPYTIGDYLAPLLGTKPVPVDDPVFTRSRARRSTSRCGKLLSINGNKTVDEIHRELGQVLWDNCGMARTEQSLTKALAEIPAIREEFWKNVRVLGENETRNQALEKAGRVADFLEFGELMCSTRCSATSRAAGTSARSTRPKTARRCATTSTSRTSPRGSGPASATSPSSTRKQLDFEFVHPSTRSYK